ncbi:hypothetical protein DPEC_G00048330 [Dallia pectoralis]|uniref:Uncharacterized protein n=1 Tax=Dallia pectoralis TaxID=75939 RepID=A0ACC2HAL6_DALPE|nr:hypothetical protein DPEC_G00048330 [Dallia pectoralis]
MLKLIDLRLTMTMFLSVPAMDLRQMWFYFISILCFSGSTRAVGEFCKDYIRNFDRVFSVPGDADMLTCTLLAPNVFNYTTVPYNISWYNSKTWKELTGEKGKIVVRGTTLWIFNIEMEDAGDYTCIIRTPSGCFKQSNLLIVNQIIPDTCSRPYATEQKLTNKVKGKLSCPLKNHIRTVDSYTIQWYKECEPITNSNPLWDRFSIFNEELDVSDVRPEDRGLYTCTVTFNLEGHSGRVSETINGTVKMSYSLEPKIVEPVNDTVKAVLGSPLKKNCRVFVPGTGKPTDTVIWMDENNFLSENHSHDVFQAPQIVTRDETGAWLERPLNFRVVKQEDFSINYTCWVFGFRSHVSAYFTLLPTDPNYMIPIGILLTGLLMIFTVSAFIYHCFKMDIVLSFRRMCPFLYTNTESDGKLYDAYVTYPSLFGGGVSGEAEIFALHMLPQFLEERCGYKLFILGRDSLPGQAIVDAVEESIQASRRLILVYSGTTFGSQGHSDTNNDTNRTMDACQSFERQTAMHSALLEGSLQVILVELEKITPTQLDFFPESVLHLRNRQGAVCLWKSSRLRWNRRLKCGGRREKDEGEDIRGELALPSLSSSSRFWKELRYYMPVKGKRMWRP